jgi:hypothetical protein
MPHTLTYTSKVPVRGGSERLFGRIRVGFFSLQNKICPFLPQGMCIYVGHSFLMKHSWINYFQINKAAFLNNKKIHLHVFVIWSSANCAPLLADLFLYSYEADSDFSWTMKRSYPDPNFTFRYIGRPPKIRNMLSIKNSSMLMTSVSENFLVESEWVFFLYKIRSVPSYHKVCVSTLATI